MAGGLNTYDYALQNPINYFDPNGATALHAGRFAFGVGTRIGAAVNYAIQAATGASLGILLYEAVNEINESSSDDATDAVDDGAEDCGDDEECKRLAKKIKKVMKELHKRYMHQCRNRKNQWDSHLPAYEGKRRQLEKLVIESESKGCAVFAKAYQWLGTECPVAGTKTPPPQY